MTFLAKVRAQHPLIHNITNMVVTNFTANGLLALGASPFMAYAHEEVADVAAIANAVVLNIGTLDPYTVESIQRAGRAANESGVPIVFDPVGAGATPYRTQSALQIIEHVQVDVLRGNVAEVANVIGESWQIKGVDAGAGEGNMIQIAEQAAQKLKCIVAITGEKDVVTDGQNTYTIANSHQILTQVTGGGCLLSAVVGAFIAVADPAQAQERLEAVTEALAFYGIAAEIAYEQTAGQGTGSFQMQFINQLSLVTPEIVTARAQITSSKA